MAILILVFIALTATVCCVADWGGDLSLIASMLPTGYDGENFLLHLKLGILLT